jgi:hypothetical protein
LAVYVQPTKSKNASKYEQVRSKADLRKMNAEQLQIHQLWRRTRAQPCRCSISLRRQSSSGLASNRNNGIADITTEARV